MYDKTTIIHVHSHVLHYLSCQEFDIKGSGQWTLTLEGEKVIQDFLKLLISLLMP